MNVRIHIANMATDRLRWAEFVQAHPQGTVFQSPEMYALYEQTPKHRPYALLATEGEKLIGVLSAVIICEHKGWLGKFSARGILLGAPLVAEGDTQTADLLLKAYHCYARKRVVYSQVRNLSDVSVLHEAFLARGYQYEPHLNILIDLTRTTEQLTADLHQGRWRNIVRATRRGLQFRENNSTADIEASIRLIKKTYRRIRLPLPDAGLFGGARKMLGEQVRFFGACCEGEMVASRIVFCYNDVVYDWFTGSDEKYKNKYPNDFLTWQVILWAKKNGYRVFDFGGAGNPDVPYGVRTFKSRFGGETVEYGRYLRVFQPFLYRLGKFVMGK